jgi:hypothetical protein
MQLPNKETIKNWNHEPTIYRLMSENRWTYAQSKQWFNDFMCWLYTSMRCEQEYDKEFVMDSLHYLDDVWHAYILHTKDYFQMCQTLFDKDFIHHDPENPFASGEFKDEDLVFQMNLLIEDWGNEYVDRVWQYGADMHDIINKAL